MSVVAYFNPDRPSYLLNPYPALARLRTEEPVHWSPAIGAWVVTSYRLCAEALYDPDRFPTSPTDRPYDASAPRPLVKIDGGDHDRLRRVVAQALAPKSARAAVARLRSIIAEGVAAWPSGEPFEFTSFAAQVVEDALPAYAGIGTTVTVHEARQLIQRAATGIIEYDLLFEAALGDADPESLASAVATGIEQETLSPIEGVHLLADILSAGSDATAFALANAAAALAAHPDSYASIGQDIDVALASEELLRFDSSTQAVARVACEDTTLGGVRVREGDELMLMVGAANRDPEMFAEADRLDLRRSPNRHLSFAVGMHYCLGAPLARQIITETLRQVRERFERLALGPGGGVRRGNFALRGFATLEVIGS
jgi:cytochrome P450